MCDVLNKVRITLLEHSIAPGTDNMLGHAALSEYVSHPECRLITTLAHGGAGQPGAAVHLFSPSYIRLHQGTQEV